MKKMITFIILLILFSGIAFGLPLLQAGDFQIKKVTNKNILYVIHTEDKGLISNSLIKLIQYYLLNDSQPYKVVFPQMSIESKNIKGSYYAIGYEGSPEETNEIKTTQLQGGLFASYIYKGSYKNIGSAIRGSFKKILKAGKYVPHDEEESRLLYRNSIDDNHPKDLITEIQIRVLKIP